MQRVCGVTANICQRRRPRSLVKHWKMFQCVPASWPPMQQVFSNPVPQATKHAFFCKHTCMRCGQSLHVICKQHRFSTNQNRFDSRISETSHLVVDNNPSMSVSCKPTGVCICSCVCQTLYQRVHLKNQNQKRECDHIFAHSRGVRALLAT